MDFRNFTINDFILVLTEFNQKVEKLEQLFNRWDVKKDEVSQWMNIDELRTYLPDKPSRKTIYKWVSNNAIPYYKSSKALRFNKAEIDNWLRQGKQETMQEMLVQLNDAPLIPIKRKGGAHE